MKTTTIKVTRGDDAAPGEPAALWFTIYSSNCPYCGRRGIKTEAEREVLIAADVDRLRRKLRHFFFRSVAAAHDRKGLAAPSWLQLRAWFAAANPSTEGVK
jgi:hypothetical protein